MAQVNQIMAEMTRFLEVSNWQTVFHIEMYSLIKYVEFQGLITIVE
jgi:hypothetical protein